MPDTWHKNALTRKKINCLLYLTNVTFTTPLAGKPLHYSTGGTPSLLHWQSQLHWRDPLHDSTGRTPLGNRQQNARPPPLSKFQPIRSAASEEIRTKQTDSRHTHTNTSTTYPAICPVEGDLVAMNTSLISTSAFQYHTTQPKTHQQGQDQDSNCQHQDSDFASL